MTQPPTLHREQFTVQQRYRDNFARHLLGVSLYLQNEIMCSLTESGGHAGLRLNFQPYITIIGTQGARLSDIAECLGVSRQAANQIVNQIEAAGYIERRKDHTDGRAKLLCLTTNGIQLREAGMCEAHRLQQQASELVGRDALCQAMETLESLNRKLALNMAPGGDDKAATDSSLADQLSRLSDYILGRVMTLTIERGHPGLKLSFGQVLTAIGPEGGRIQQMAKAHGVSKQAISAIATELEEMGYIYRVVDSADARQILLQFTDRGHHLIADSVAAVDDLRSEFTAFVGSRALKQLCDTLHALYRSLQLEQDIFEQVGNTDLHTLAQQLIHQLGSDGARSLGQLLLSPAIPER